MSTFFILFFVGIASIVSWLGWGWLVTAGFLRIREQNSSWLLGTGLAVTVLVGGVLNGLRAISPTSLTTYLSLGCGLGIIYLFKQRLLLWHAAQTLFIDTSKKVTILILLCLIGLIGLRYASMISVPTFNSHDDYQGYFVFPAKMLQTGSIGADPFSERRLVTSVGGQAFLDTFVLQVGDFKNLAFPDAGIGYLAFIAIMAGFLGYLKIPRTRFVLIMFLLALMPVPSVNTTAYYTALCLFTMLIWFFYLEEKPRHAWIVALQCAIVIAALGALRNSYAPACGVLLLAFCWKQYGSPLRSRASLKYLLLTSLFAAILISPWLVTSLQSSGTLYYPLLGKGFHGSAVGGTFLTATSELSIGNIKDFLWEIENPLFTVIALLVLMYLSNPEMRKHIGKEERFLALATLITFIIVSGASAGYGVYRFSFAFVFPFAFLLLARLQHSVAVALICILLGSSLNSFFLEKGYMKRALIFAAQNGDIVSEADRKQYKDLQQSVPAGEIILARLDRNFLFDFARNPVYIADYPGAASLPPGMPFFKGPELLAQYLHAKGIKYIAYSYGNAANFPRAGFEDRLSPTVNAWVRTEAAHTFDFQENVEQLGQTQKKVYDDGKNFVLELL